MAANLAGDNDSDLRPSGSGGKPTSTNEDDYTGSSNEHFNNAAEGYYQSMLGRGSDTEGYNAYSKFYDPNSPDTNYGADKVKGMILGSDEYKKRSTGGSPSGPTPPIQNITNTGTPAPPATNTTYDPNRPRVTPTAGTAVGYASNPQLDALIQQMLASEKANQARQDADAKTKADFNMKIRSNIMDQYNKADQPVDPNDPTIAGLRQTHDAASQRALNQGREAMAARGAAEGTPTGANDAQVQSSYENLGRDNAEYGANLQYDELNKRRSMISSLLSQGEGILNPDESRTLSDKLGTMDASMKNLGLKSGAYLDGSRIDNQNTQFYDNMSNNNSLQAALMNEMMMREMMGGA